MDLVGRPAVIFEVAGGDDHIVARLLQRLARVAGLELRQFLRMVRNRDGEFAQETTALGGAEPAPRAALYGGAGRLDSRVYVGGAAGGDRRKYLAVSRSNDGNGFAGSARQPAVVDENTLGGGDGDLHVHEAPRYWPVPLGTGSGARGWASRDPSRSRWIVPADLRRMLRKTTAPRQDGFVLPRIRADYGHVVTRICAERQTPDRTSSASVVLQSCSMARAACDRGRSVGSTR